MTKNTLFICTDEEPPNWLKYILDQFIIIQQPKFKIEVIKIGSSSEELENVIYYSKELDSKYTIPNCSESQLNSEISYLSENFYVLSNTVVDNAFISYDLFWNAFVFLSRKEEYESENKGKFIYSYNSNHPRKDKESFEIPIVNLLFDELESLISKNYSGLLFEMANDPIIELSHDLDYIHKTIQLRIKQTAFNSLNTLKSIIHPSKFIENAVKTCSFLFGTPSYWCFDYWKELESSSSFRSVFYIYAGRGNSKGIRSWLIDPSYDVRLNKVLQNKIKELYAEGFKIGLHGSYNSATENNTLKQEKDILTNSLNIGIDKVRQHWLNFREEKTPYFHNELFIEDSTLAWNDRIGFRSGCASKYQPYDHKNDKSFDYQEIPQIIMDSNIYDYASGNRQHVINKGLLMLKELKKIKNSHVSLSWHPRTCSVDYNWHPTYELYLKNINNYKYESI